MEKKLAYFFPFQKHARHADCQQFSLVPSQYLFLRNADGFFLCFWNASKMTTSYFTLETIRVRGQKKIILKFRLSSGEIIQLHGTTFPSKTRLVLTVPGATGLWYWEGFFCWHALAVEQLVRWLVGHHSHYIYMYTHTHTCICVGSVCVSTELCIFIHIYVMPVHKMCKKVLTHFTWNI